MDLILGGQTNDPDIVKENFEKIADALKTITPGGAVWGTITGYLPDQGDLTSYITGLGYITGITGGIVTTALGYTPYDAANPAGYITASSANTLTNKTWNGNVIAAIYGGTGWGSYTVGDMLYAYDASTLAKLPKGTNGEVLTMVSGVPGWAAAGGGAAAGSTGEIQFNNSGAFAASPLLTFNSNILKIGNPGHSSEAVTIRAGVPYGATGYIQFNHVGGASGQILSADPNGGFKSNGSLTAATALVGGTLLSGKGIVASSVTSITPVEGSLCLSPNTWAQVNPFINFSVSSYSNKACLGIAGSTNNDKTGNDLIYTVNPSSVTAFDGTERFRVKQNGNFLIGTSTDVASSLLTLASTIRGFLLPRMTTTNVNNISTPAEALQLYDTTIQGLKVRNASVWNNIVHSDVANTKVTAAAPYTNDGYIIVTIGGVNYKLMTTA